MYLFFLENLARPVTRRLGTAFGAYLLSVGVQGDLVNQIVAGFGAAVAVGFDLSVSYLNRKR